MELAAMTKEDLMGLVRQLNSEISAKDSVIGKMSIQQKWAIAKGLTSAAKDWTSDYSNAIQTRTPSEESNALSMVQTMLSFKQQLTSAKEQVTRDQNALMEMSQKQTLLEEEIVYLRTIANHPDSKETAANQRFKDLEFNYRAALTDLTALQQSVKTWTKVSEKNQEARIQAEAAQKVLQEELKQTQGNVESKQKIALLEKRLEEYDEMMQDAYAEVETLEAQKAEITTALRENQELVNDLQLQLKSKEELPPIPAPEEFNPPVPEKDYQMEKIIEMQAHIDSLTNQLKTRNV